MDSDLYHKLYDFEFEQRSHLASNVNIPIAATTFLFGALSTITIKFNYSNDLTTIIFSIFSILSLITLTFSLIFIFKSLLGYEYQKLPSPNELAAHHKELYKWHLENRSTKEEADIDFKQYLSTRLAESAEWNSRNNISRGSYIYRATFSIAICVIFLFVAVSVFFYQDFNSEDHAQKVEIIGPIHLIQGGTTMTTEDEEKPATPSSTAEDGKTDQSTTNKPTGPPNTFFKSHTILKNTKKETK